MAVRKAEPSATRVFAAPGREATRERREEAKAIREEIAKLVRRHNTLVTRKGRWKFAPVVDILAPVSDVEPKYSAKGKTLRKAFERPHPELPSNAPQNRQRKQIAVTLPHDLVEEVTKTAKARGMDRARLIEAAIRNFLAL